MLSLSHRGIIALAVVVIAETLAQTSLEASLSPKKRSTLMLVLGIIGYVVVAIAYRFVLKDAPMGIANVVWNAATGLSVCAVGYFVFGEKLTMKQLLGILLVFIGGALL